MDLIYTNADRIDQGILTTYSFDLSFGTSENDFEMTLGADAPMLAYGAFAYFEGTEYGGIIDAMAANTDGESITYKGRTWHGILNSKVIQPVSGENYYVVSGNSNEVIATLIAHMGLESLFTADANAPSVNIKKYQFKRYCMGYDGLKDMLAANGAKLKIVWKDRAVLLYAEPVVDYSDDPIDGDMAKLSVEKHGIKVNHLICLGSGNLAEREIIHLYADAFGQIVDTPYYTGLDEYADTYDYGNCESSEELRKGGIERFKELRDVDSADLSMPSDADRVYDIGDIVGTTEVRTGISVAAAVAQKIVRIVNGAISIDYATGG